MQPKFFFLLLGFLTLCGLPLSALQDLDNYQAQQRHENYFAVGVSDASRHRNKSVIQLPRLREGNDMQPDAHVQVLEAVVPSRCRV